jgi:hypothetical protein
MIPVISSSRVEAALLAALTAVKQWFMSIVNN